MDAMFSTQRLLLNLVTESDHAFVIRLLNSEGWLQFIGDRNVHTTADAEKYLENGPMRSYATNGFGLWCVELKDTRQAIGMCGLIRRDTLDDIDIGFSMLPVHNGKGYGYQAAIATMQFAKEQLKLKRVVAITNDDNIVSGKLLEKLGFRFERMIEMDNETLKLFGIQL